MSRARFGRILCAIDFSDLSLRALEHAAALAQWSAAHLGVVHIVAPPDFRLVGTAPLTADERARRLEEMRRFVEPATGALPPALALREGEAAAGIAAECLAWSADLLVVGTHGRRGLAHWELGSVAEAAIRRAPCPVLTVPRDAPAPDRSTPAPFQRILCAVDLGPSSGTTLEYALSLALQARARVGVVYAMEEIPADGRRMELRLGVPWFGAYRETVEKQAQERLRELLPDEVRVACSVEEILVAGKAPLQVTRVLRERRADLLVMGAGGASMLPFGSTVAKVLRHAACPILTVPSRAAVRAASPIAGRSVVVQPAH
jgi:nucleotide-binding universal stress UspA family protein